MMAGTNRDAFKIEPRAHVEGRDARILEHERDRAHAMRRLTDDSHARNGRERSGAAINEL